MMKPKLIFLLLVMIASLAFSAVEKKTTGDAKLVTIRMLDYDFQPSKITIDAGTTVEWINAGKHVHTVTDDASAWDSGNLKTGEKFAHRFDQKGTFKYVCVPHEEIGMTGTIVVK
jgi:plastocyanin